jgi:hypothetical protein
VTKLIGETAMAELEPGHPDELTKLLKNWLQQTDDPIGSLPEGTDPVEWAIRRFIDSWKKPIRSTIEVIEECLNSALELCDAGDSAEARAEIDSALQLVRESLRDELGLYEWNEENI